MSSVYINLISHISSQIPKFEIIQKSKSLFMKFLNIFLGLFNKTFMTDFTTTIYPKIYIPIGFEQWTSKTEILAHEYIHLSDRKKLGILFNLIYLSPQIFSLLALLSFWNLWFLLFLLFLLPIPSIGRTILEYRGYVCSIAVYYWLFGKKYDIDFIVDQFTSSNYYFMFPFKSYLTKKFEQEYKKIIQNEYSFKTLQEIHDILKK